MKNIRILLPLSYGHKPYAEEIATYAEKLFGSKAICLRDLIPYNEYLELLDSVDIFILNAKRQVALGNVHQFFRKGKKIFLPRESVLSKYYKDNGIEICDIESLSTCDIDYIYEDINYLKAKQWMWDYDHKDPVELWRNVFNQIINN